MNVTLSDDHFGLGARANDMSPAPGGNFMHMKTTATEAEPKTPSTLPAPKQITLSDRVIHPFKAALKCIGLSALTSSVIGAVPGIFVLYGIGCFTNFAGSTIGSGLGGLVKLSKKIAGCPSEAMGKGLYMGGAIGSIVAIPPALITTAALSLAAFSVIAPVTTILNIPRSIYHAITWSDSQINKWDHKAKKDLQTIKNELKKASKGIDKRAGVIKSKLNGTYDPEPNIVRDSSRTVSDSSAPR